MDAYSDDDDNVMYDDDDDDASMQSVEAEGCEDESMAIKKSNDYKVLTKLDIQKNQDDDIAALSSALSVSKTVAIILLQNYKWHVENAQEAWFNDEDGVRTRVGLLKKPVVECRKPGDSLVCGICFDTYIFQSNCFEFCGHSFCGTCLKSYISTAINESGKCLFLRCPEPSCHAAIGEDVVNLLVCDEDKKRYRGFMARSYVETNKKIKWCPSPGCECAIECELGSESFGVTCNCLHTFCWNCVEDYHRPLQCETVENWMLQLNLELGNSTWILANSKPCPKCNVPIEKNSGCMHMTCNYPCGYEFCWICLGAWERHDTKACNAYKERIKFDEDNEVAMAKKDQKSYQRYVHYYERWDANHKSREMAIANLHEVKATKLEQLGRKFNRTPANLEFITYAWEQIIEGRRALKWTYVYGYLMPQEESMKKKLFDFLQGEAEVALEQLHYYAEVELNEYLDDIADSHKFYTEFCAKLPALAKAAGRYFANFLKGVENGLSEADDTPLATEEELGYWKCQECTYFNDIEHNSCYVCLHTKGDYIQKE